MENKTDYQIERKNVDSDPLHELKREIVGPLETNVRLSGLELNNSDYYGWISNTPTYLGYKR